MNWLKYLTVLGVLCVNGSGIAQPFVQLSDASGLTLTSEQLDELEAAAANLVAVLPPEFQNQFKVYDFGFYLHNEVFDGGYPAVFEKVIAEVSSDPTTPYYLLFGRQTDRTGVNTKIWVDLELPLSWLTNCYDEKYLSSLEIRLLGTFPGTGNQPPSLYHPTSELSAIGWLNLRFLEFASCCIQNARTTSECSSCFPSSDVETYITQFPFTSFPVEVISGEEDHDDECLCDGSSNNNNTTNLRSKRSNLNVLEFGSEINVKDGEYEYNLTDKASKFVDIYGASEAFAVITTNSDYCAEDFDNIVHQLMSYPKSLWIHISSKSGTSNLFYWVRGIEDKIIIGSCNQQHRGQLECILNQFRSSGSSLVNEIIKDFDSSKKDIIINVDCPPSNNTAHGQTIDALLGKLGIVEIYINPEQFEIIDDFPLNPASTLLHELCHGLISLNVFRAGGPENCSWLHYNPYFRSYQDEGLTDECIIARYFIDRQADALWRYNTRTLDASFYLSTAWGPYFSDYKACKENVDYTLTQISDNYLIMREATVSFPCLSTN